MTDATDTQGNVLLVEDAESFRQRWESIQSGFVDEPKRAVKEADALVSELITSLSDAFTAERQNLEKQWSSGGEVSTDDLRGGLQRYRSFFRRLLSQSGPDASGSGETTAGAAPSGGPQPNDQAGATDAMPAPLPRPGTSDAGGPANADTEPLRDQSTTP